MPSLLYRLPLFFRLLGAEAITEDHKQQIEVLRENEADVDWVAVCPPRITGRSFTGEYTVTENERPAGTRGCSKHHIADLMVKCLKDDQYLGKTISCGDDSSSCVIL